MKISLKQVEIDGILASYLNKNGISTEGKTITTTYTAGRKNSGLSVEIEISDSTLTAGSHVDEVKTTVETQAEVTNESAGEAAPEKLFD